MVVTVTGVALAVMLAGALWTDVPLGQAVADTYEVTGQRMIGLVSTVGVLLWAGTVAICLSAAGALRHLQEQLLWRRLFMTAGAVLALFLLDDFLAVHEVVDDVASGMFDF